MSHLVESWESLGVFMQALPPRARVLELGTLATGPSRSTHHGAAILAASPGGEHVKSDFQAGYDVDVVADCHNLVGVFGEASFDAVLAVSVWEHLARPWVAGDQVRRVLKPGGVALIVTHQTFPLHGYPSDFFRFSTHALAVCFEGMEPVRLAYEFPCAILQPREITEWDPRAPCFLNVTGLFRNPSC